jgi:hypothetical protein
MGETIEQRAEFAAQLAELEPDEVPLNFLNPRHERNGDTDGSAMVTEATNAVGRAAAGLVVEKFTVAEVHAVRLRRTARRVPPDGAALRLSRPPCCPSARPTSTRRRPGSRPPVSR